MCNLAQGAWGRNIVSFEGMHRLHEGSFETTSMSAARGRRRVKCSAMKPRPFWFSGHLTASRCASSWGRAPELFTQQVRVRKVLFERHWVSDDVEDVNDDTAVSREVLFVRLFDSWGKLVMFRYVDCLVCWWCHLYLPILFTVVDIQCEFYVVAGGSSWGCIQTGIVCATSSVIWLLRHEVIMWCFGRVGYLVFGIFSLLT